MKTNRRSRKDGRPDPKNLAEIVQSVVEAAQPDKIILFGSAARGEMGPNSDIDLLVIKSGKFNHDRVTRPLYRHLPGVEAVDALVVTPQDLEQSGDSPYLVYYPALREGRVIYDSGKKEGLIPTRRVRSGSGAFPSQARPVCMRKHAELPREGDRARKRSPPADPREWLNRARSNLEGAGQATPGRYLEDLCFEAQQAAQKAVKAVFIHRGARFPYTHDLEKLLQPLEQNGFKIPRYVRDAKDLTRFALVTRYPGSSGPITRRQYRRALRNAGGGVRWAERQVEKPSFPRNANDER